MNYESELEKRCDELELRCRVLEEACHLRASEIERLKLVNECSWSFALVAVTEKGYQDIRGIHYDKLVYEQVVSILHDMRNQWLELEDIYISSY
jgi:hypothetical protein